MNIPEVRRIGSEEWRELRRLRLEALRDTPLAFGSTYASDAAVDDAAWQRWAADAAAATHEVIVVGVSGGRWVAMARGSVANDEPADAFLTAVYVTPAWRGHGLGRAVSAAVIAWARARGLARMRLHVAGWNDAARRTYESLGFVATGATEPLPHDPSVTEHEMALVL